MLLCVAALKEFSALSGLEEGVLEEGQCILILHSGFLGNLHAVTQTYSQFPPK